MKNIRFIILILTFFSCKKNNQSFVKETKREMDTIFCKSSNFLLTESLSMYDDQYTSYVKRYPLLKKAIRIRKNTLIEVCYHNEFSITLLKKEDTVLSFKANMDLFTEEFITFYKNLDRSELKNLKLDSIRYGGARTRTLYYDCYFSNFVKNKIYETTIGVDYLRDIGTIHLSTYFREVTY